MQNSIRIYGFWLKIPPFHLDHDFRTSNIDKTDIFELCLIYFKVYVMENRINLPDDCFHYSLNLYTRDFLQNGTLCLQNWSLTPRDRCLRFEESFSFKFIHFFVSNLNSQIEN